MKKTIVGISGYIGSGKTTVARYFENLGAFFINADAVVESLYQPGKPGYLKISNYFGKEFLTSSGMLNRKKLARFVFADQHKLKILNFLIHPLVTSEVQKLVDQSLAAFIVVEATYFEKKHLGRLVDKILWVECEKSLLKERVLLRPGMTEKLFELIFKTQTKPEKIDFTVENNGSVEELYKKLAFLSKSIIESANNTI